MNLKDIWKKIIAWYKTKPDKKAEEEEFDEMLEEMEKRLRKIPAEQKFVISHETRPEIALMFENAYTQRKMVEANNSLKAATWVLAVATIAFTIGTVYGVTELNNTVRISLQVVLGIIVVGLASWVLGGVWKFIKFILSLIKKKK